MSDKQYDTDILEEINGKADLFAYAQQYLSFEKRGNDYFTHCPRHVDKTASLSFTPEKNMYYCFSCGKGGGIVSYLINIEGLDFDTAIQKAGKIANVDTSKMCHSDTILLLKQYRNYYRSKQHGITEHPILPPDTMSKFSKEPITEWEKEGISPDVMDLFGIRIDKLHNKIVYPVYDMNGNLINVKGRTLYKNYKQLGIMKYINYEKVYTMDYFQCLETTLPYIQEKGEVIIFESIKSVMKMFGWGYKNCVSAEKHNLTPEQVMLLAKLKVDVVFAYDTDVNYSDKSVKQNIDSLKRVTNVYIVREINHELGGKESKNAPVDCGKEIWDTLYAQKRKVV
jgi:DNA primase